MRHAGAKRAILGALGVDMNPLMVAGGIGKGVDALLRDGDPVGGAQVISHGRPHASHRIKAGGVGVRHAQAC